MFRIRPVYNDINSQDREAIGQAQQILREQFPGLREEDIAKIPDQLHNPQDYGFRSILFVAEGARGQMRGVAMLLHFPAPGFCYLEYLSAAPGTTGRGVGSALYERVREEARALSAVALFFEALPDEPALSPDPVLQRQNRARLRFYERYGARPIVGTAYETPLKPGAPNPPYLVLDSLGRFEPLGRARARTIVRSILEAKYRRVCSPDYIQKVVASFRDDPIRLREPRYTNRQPLAPELTARHPQRIALIVNDKHLIHHMRERGYVEAPVRIEAILKELTRTGLFERVPARLFSEELIRAVHDAGFVRYLKRACARVPPEKSIYPYVFPVHNTARPPRTFRCARAITA